jgi:glyoxylase-like metal-dependent hydrolase (beta-lactamase superfamily II)
MFPDIPVVDAWATWNRVDYTTAAPILAEGIRIEKTPGHTYDSLTLFVDTVDGIVAICGDVMWWEGDTQSDVYAENIEVLRATRAKVLENADIVIPGHGPRFAVKK